MRPLLCADEARAMDAHAVERLGMDSLVLMENAGRGAAARIREAHPDALRHVVLVGGVGQNGGDAWVVARHLALEGIRTTCLLVDEGGREPRGDAARNLAILDALGHRVERIDANETRALEVIPSASLVVDALYGTGLSRDVDGIAIRVIDAFDLAISLGRPVVSLDVPSGIDPDTGASRGVAVRASRTITFGHLKRGLFQGAGARNAGSVDVVSIGAPLANAPLAFLLGMEDVAAYYPARAADAHKGVAGHVLVVAGTEGTTGAALLAARGAARGGAGLVTLATKPSARAALDARVLEWMTTTYETADELLERARGKRAIVLGPGLGRDDETHRLVTRIAREALEPVVLDADALTLLARDGLESLTAARGPRVLTPHPGEAAVLLGQSKDEIQHDRHHAARLLAERSRCTVVLKGMGTIVATPDEPDLVCSRGTPAMGTGGTGDVLAGLLGAVVRAESLHRVVGATVLVHAVAGELAARSDRGMLASELADAVPEVLRQAGRGPTGGSANLT